MPAPGRCPPAQLLQTLCNGKLSAEQEGTLVGHLDSCRCCQQVLEGLDRSGAWPIHLSVDIAPLAEPLRQAMQRLKASAPQLLSRARIPEERPLPAALLSQASYEGWLGPYEIMGVIGRGGMGVVLKGFDAALHRLVAIKVLAPHLADNLAARRRFAREGRAAAAVSHEHVVAIHAVGEAHGLPYLVMEYVPGISVQERLDRAGPLDVRTTLRIAIQAASGLAAAHAQGLVHRDVKPANILLENDVERVKLTDFGLARAIEEARLTQSGLITGTPEYMAPEQARGEATDHRADLFSLGSVLYAACTGQPPFRASSPLAVLQRVCTEEPTPIRQLNPAISPWLAGVIAILHAKDPARRFGSAAELVTILSQYLTHLEQPSVQPRPPRLARRRWQWGQHLQQRTPRFIAGLLFLAMVLSSRLGSGPRFHATPAERSEPAEAVVVSSGTAPDSASLPPQVQMAHPRDGAAGGGLPPREMATQRFWVRLKVSEGCVLSMRICPDERNPVTGGDSRTSRGVFFVWDSTNGRKVLYLPDTCDLILWKCELPLTVPAVMPAPAPPRAGAMPSDS